MKKVAIIGRVTHPHECPRSNRIKYLAIELVRQGYDVTVFCLLGNYNYEHFTNTYGVKIENLGKSYLGNGNSDTGKQSTKFIFRFFKRLFGRVFMFPEIELIYLIYKNRFKILNHDILISVAAPFAIHFGVNSIYDKKRLWISDCGDPFMGNPHYSYPFYFKFLENSWIRNTNFVTVPTKKAIFAYSKEHRNKIFVIPQGFPKIDNLKDNYNGNEIVTFCYSGAIYPDLRDPTLFLDYLCSLKIDFRFIVYTKSIQFFDKYKVQLGDKLVLRNYIKRDDLLIELSKVDFLINIKNVSEVQVPSKIIDYLQAGRPILEISTAFKEEEKKKFDKYLSLQFPEMKQSFSQYDIVNVTKQFIDLFNA